MNRNIQQTWRTGLVVVVAALYAWVGVSVHGPDQLLGLLGALLIIAALAVAPRSPPIATGLLLLGTLPLAVMTWWSVVTPLLAVLCLLLGWPRLNQDVGSGHGAT
jgi:hypothetical protein